MGTVAQRDTLWAKMQTPVEIARSWDLDVYTLMETLEAAGRIKHSKSRNTRVQQLWAPMQSGKTKMAGYPCLMTQCQEENTKYWLRG
jgi:hypothetical protein